MAQLGGLSGQSACQPSRQTEVSQAMNELSQINSILLDKLQSLNSRLQAVRSPKPQAPCNKKDEVMPQPCELASTIRVRAIEVAQAVNNINILLEEIEL